MIFGKLTATNVQGPRHSLRVYCVALLCSGLVHAAMFAPEWWQHEALSLERTSLNVSLNVSAYTDEANTAAAAAPVPFEAKSAQQTPRLPAETSVPVPQTKLVAKPPLSHVEENAPPSPVVLARKTASASPMESSEPVADTLQQASFEQEQSAPMTVSVAEPVTPPVFMPPSAGAPQPPVSPAPIESSAPVVSPPAFRIGSAHNPDPVYPGIALRRGWQGEVLLGVEVDTDGRTRSVEVLSSSGYSVLDNAALKTIRDQWVFQPARENNIAVLGYTRVPVRFEFN
ncbi:MAG: energy transducer TonB [Oleiphilaceae bacterium]|nr:energy transducer TonB [Oleiphilaceae bacterium]